MSFAHVPAFKVVIVSKFVLLVSDVEIRLASLIIFRDKHGGTRFANISGIFLRLFLFVCLFFLPSPQYWRYAVSASQRRAGISERCY